MKTVIRFVLIRICVSISWCLIISRKLSGGRTKEYWEEMRKIGPRHAPGLWIISHITSQYRNKKRRAWVESICERYIGHDVTYGDTGWSVGGDMLDCHCRWCDKIIKMPIRETHIGMSAKPTSFGEGLGMT